MLRSVNYGRPWRSPRCVSSPILSATGQDYLVEIVHSSIRWTGGRNATKTMSACVRGMASSRTSRQKGAAAAGCRHDRICCHPANLGQLEGALSRVHLHHVIHRALAVRAGMPKNRHPGSRGERPADRPVSNPFSVVVAKASAVSNMTSSFQCGMPDRIVSPHARARRANRPYSGRAARPAFTGDHQGARNLIND
jgi:hypothetical protein